MENDCAFKEIDRSHDPCIMGLSGKFCILVD